MSIFYSGWFVYCPATNLLSISLSAQSVQWMLGVESNLTISVTDSNVTEMDNIEILVNFTGSGATLTEIGVGRWIFKWRPLDRSNVSLTYVFLFQFILFYFVSIVLYFSLIFRLNCCCTRNLGVHPETGYMTLMNKYYGNVYSSMLIKTRLGERLFIYVDQ